MTVAKTRKHLSLAAIAYSIVLLTGCRIVSPGVTYNMNWLEALISATPQDVTEATKSAIQDMNLVLISAESTGLDGKVVARTARKKVVTVTITRSARNVSRVQIQVGRLGDEATSMLVFEKIKERL